jgi:small subunit ribosomal protein S3Ae
MALARTRQAARRVKDRWKAKQNFKIIAPATFNQHPLGETLADEGAKLMGRKVEITMNEMTGDMKQMHVKLFFQVNDVADFTAKTTFVGHTMTSDYVRRLTRRGHTKIPAVFDLRTKDGSRVRVKPFAISDRRCQTTQAQAIRQVMHDMLEASAKKHTLAGFLKEILVDDLNTRIYKEARKIHPLRRIEIAKTEILKAPAVEVDETPVISLTPEPTEGEGIEGDGEVVEGADTDVETDAEE